MLEISPIIKSFMRTVVEDFVLKSMHALHGHPVVWNRCERGETMEE